MQVRAEICLYFSFGRNNLCQIVYACDFNIECQINYAIEGDYILCRYLIHEMNTELDSYLPAIYHMYIDCY